MIDVCSRLKHAVIIYCLVVHLSGGFDLRSEFAVEPAE